MKDLYKILNVAEDAPDDVIKKAYRKLAKENHPDATGGDKRKTERFKEIGEAYAVLGDKEKRSEYDRLKHAPVGADGMPQGFDADTFAQVFGGRGGPGGVNVSGDFSGDFGDLFSSLFGRGFGGGGARRGCRAGPTWSAPWRSTSARRRSDPDAPSGQAAGTTSRCRFPPGSIPEGACDWLVRGHRRHRRGASQGTCTSRCGSCLIRTSAAVTKAAATTSNSTCR
jgi:molecular chaperone DnaJ